MCINVDVFTFWQNPTNLYSLIWYRVHVHIQNSQFTTKHNSFRFKDTSTFESVFYADFVINKIENAYIFKQDIFLNTYFEYLRNLRCLPAHIILKYIRIFLNPLYIRTPCFLLCTPEEVPLCNTFS